jgi:hypothetical protein
VKWIQRLICGKLCKENKYLREANAYYLERFKQLKAERDLAIAQLEKSKNER